MAVKSLIYISLVLTFTLIWIMNMMSCESEEQYVDPELKREAKEVLPLLFNVTYIKQTTHNYDYLRVYLKEVPKKGGLGVFARRRILANRTIMYYKTKIYSKDNYNVLSNGLYSFIVKKKNGEDFYEDLVGDIYELSVDKPRGRIPYWGYIANEPSEDETPNCNVSVNTEENFRYRDIKQSGDILLYKLFAARDIAPDEEITWCYGKYYVRSYKTGCND